MDDEPYPDRDAWPGYWRAIRTFAAWAAASILVIGGSSFITRPEELIPRLAFDALTGVCLLAVGTAAARWLNAWWETRGA